MSSPAEKLRVVAQLAEAAANAPPVVFEHISAGHGLFTAHRLREGLTAVQHAKIVGLSFSQSPDNLKISAYIMSAHVGRLFYLTSLTFPHNQLWTSLKWSCTCIGGKSMLCQHGIALLLLLALSQTAPTHRPSWLPVPSSIPSKNSKNSTDRFKQRWAKQPVYADSPQELLYLMTRAPSDRSDLETVTYTFQFEQKDKKTRGTPRLVYKTTSWRIAAQHLTPPPSQPPAGLQPPVTSQAIAATSQAISSTSQTSSVSQLSTAAETADRTPRTLICRICKCPRKGHKKGAPCPSLPPSSVQPGNPSTEHTSTPQTASNQTERVDGLSSLPSQLHRARAELTSTRPPLLISPTELPPVAAPVAAGVQLALECSGRISNETATLSSQRPLQTTAVTDPSASPTRVSPRIPAEPILSRSPTAPSSFVQQSEFRKRIERMQADIADPYRPRASRQRRG
jgi:hypothetical protein